MGGSWIRGDGMCGEKLAGRGMRSSVAMVRGVSAVAKTRLVECASESLGFVVVRVAGDGPDVDKCSSGRGPEGIPTKGLAGATPSVPRIP